MRKAMVYDLVDCTEFGQTLQARPPRIIHGAVILLAALLGTAFTWSALTEADLVVRAPGRVRPVTSPMQVVNGSNGEVLSASAGGRVVEVNFHEGKEVRRGDVLIRLDTERLDNELLKQHRIIQTGVDELVGLSNLEVLSAHQYAAAKAKAEAELAQALEAVSVAKERQVMDVQLATLELEDAASEEAQLGQLVDRQLAPQNDLRKATVRVSQAHENLKKAELPVDERGIDIRRQEVALASNDYAVKRKELEMERESKQADVEAARMELANLKLEHQQAVIRAPMTGVVISGDLKIGDVLESGKSVVEIAEQKGFRFEAGVPSEEVGHLRLGMPARVKLDAYDYQRYGTVAGKVVFISPDSEVPEGQQTVAYIVKIALESEELGRGEHRGQVKLGMAGQAEIVTGGESLLALLVKQIRQTISLG